MKALRMAIAKLLVGRELDELDRWRLGCGEFGRFLGHEFVDVRETLRDMQKFASGSGPCDPCHLRTRLRARPDFTLTDMVRFVGSGPLTEGKIRHGVKPVGSGDDRPSSPPPRPHPSRSNDCQKCKTIVAVHEGESIHNVHSEDECFEKRVAAMIDGRISRIEEAMSVCRAKSGIPPFHGDENIG